MCIFLEASTYKRKALTSTHNTTKRYPKMRHLALKLGFFLPFILGTLEAKRSCPTSFRSYAEAQNGRCVRMDRVSMRYKEVKLS